jgi:hypothetical protein
MFKHRLALNIDKASFLLLWNYINAQCISEKSQLKNVHPDAMVCDVNDGFF